MAKTTVADLIQTPMFADYFRQAMIEQSTLIKSGIAAIDERIAQRARAAGVTGKTVTLPFFNSLDGASDDEVLTEDTALTPEKIDADADVAPICRRGKAFSATDLSADLSGQDPMAAIAAQLADYWNKMRQKRLVKVLEGVFAANATTYNASTAPYGNNSDLVLDLSAASMGKTDIMLGAQLLGDRKLELTAIAMHSAVETYLSGLDTNAGLYRASQGPATLPSYNGRGIIVDDTMPYNPSTGVATLYLFGRGAVALNDVPEKVPFETDREKLKGNDILISRIADICHLRGYAWNPGSTSIADGGPTNTQLATAALWKRVYPQKAIRCVKLVVKCA